MKTAVFSLLALSFVLVFAAVVGVAAIPKSYAIVCSTTYSPSSYVTFTPITISSSGTYCFDAGTYNTQITITGGTVTLEPVSGTVTIQPSQLSFDSYGLANIIDILGGTVTVQDLTISGQTAGASQTINSGISVGGGAIATLSDNTITYISEVPINGDQNGRAIQVGISGILDCSGTTGPDNPCTATPGTATITGNTINNYQKAGITVDGAGSSATISDNTVTGVGAVASAPAQNGIEITFGATATVSANSVSDNTYTGSGSGNNLETQNQACGVLTYQASGTNDISSNTLSSNDIGVCMYLDTGTDTVSSNTISGSTFDGIVSFDQSAVVDSNTISISPVGVGVLSDQNGFTAQVSGSSNIFSSVTTSCQPTELNGGIAICNLGGNGGLGVPEFGAPVALVAAVSLLGLFLVRKYSGLKTQTGIPGAN